MALVNKDSAIIEIERYLKKAPLNGGIEILSYKRNRTIALIKLGKDMLVLRQRGYAQEELRISADKLVKELKARMNCEFPRSRKLRLHKFAHYSELERIYQKI